MRRMLMVVATAAGMALLACGVAAAQTVSTDFEGLAPGTVNGKDGWKSAPPGAGIPGSPTGEFDQAIVANSGGPAAFGQQSLRMSNRYASGVFVYQTYSEQVLPAAGENQVNTVYDARFSFISTTPAAQQPGLYLTVSPDDYHGGRMAWVDLRDTDAGIHVNVSDAPAADGKFRTYDAGVLAREVPHTIRFWIKVNPGADNDLMRIFIDGRDLGECFTTWENYYRAPGPPPQASAPPVINSLEFRSSVTWPEPLAGAGYLFDNVTATASSGAGVTGCSPPPEPDIDIDKTTRTRFAEPGDLITYRVNVTNRGDAPVRALRACDRAPRALAFVGASRRLERVAGGRRCLMIRRLGAGQRRAFSATFRLRANVTADTMVTNGASADAMVASAPYTSPPEPLAARPRPRVLGRDAATIRVQRGRPGPCSAALTPRARAAC